MLQRMTVEEGRRQYSEDTQPSLEGHGLKDHLFFFEASNLQGSVSDSVRVWSHFVVDEIHS